MKISKKYIALGLLGSVMACNEAHATSATVTAAVAFETAITLSVQDNINFGEVKGATAAAYTIDTSGNVTTSGNGVIIGGTTQYGQVLIAGDSSTTIAISTSGYTTDNGVTLSAAMCKYGTGTPTACDSPGLTGQTAPGSSPGTVLKLGVTATSDGSAAVNTTATPSFTVNVIYG